MAMTVEETKRLERKLIERGAKDFEALKDAFELARTIDDHEYGSELRRLSREHMRTETNKAITLYQKSLIFDSSVSFDCFMRALEFNRPPEEQFWLPRRKHLMHIAQALQDMEDGKLDELFLSCPPRVGKALADDTPILTRNGWKNHGDLVVGDEVIGMDGKFKKVIAVLPKCQLDVLVEFTNGEKIQCHENHEWLLYDRAARKNKLRETWEYERVKPDSGTSGKRGHRYRFQLPKHERVIGENKNLPVDPYLFGVWLGDGANKNPRIANAESDKAIIDKIVSSGYQVRWKTHHKTTGVFYYDFDIRKQLQSFGLCHSRKRVPKYIPDIYLTASVEQRLELLAGLLDTDGTYTKKEKRYHFSTCEEELKNSFIQLVSTFGWRVNVAVHNPVVSSSGVVGRSVCYQISFCPDLCIPCELDRKRNFEFAMRRAVALKSIKRVAPKQGNCITVEGDGMYLAGYMMVPTHNTTLIQMFLLWVMGKYPEKSNLYCSFSAKPVKTFYNGLLEVLRDPDTYLYGDVCPNKRLVATNADDNTIDIDRRKKYASFTGRSIDGSLNGSCDCNGYLVGDDLCEGIEEALSPTRMRSLWTTVDNNLIPRAKESCKRLWIGTRWALIDPQGIRMDLLTNDDHYKSVRWKYINTPALNEQDESNFDYQYGVGFSSDFYKQRRASFERNSDLASWFAQFQGEPIEREGAVFDPEYMRFYNGVLPEEKPDRVFIVVDPSWGGGDYVAAVTVAQYGNDLFVPAVVFSDADKTVTQPMIAAMAIKHGATAMKVEGTRMTASYGEDIDNRLRKDGIRMNVTINTSHFTGTGKRDRIIACAPDIRERMIFLQDGIRPKEYVQFMQNMYSFTFTGKAIKHDDAPDVCAMVIDYVTVGNMSKAEIIQRPW